MAHRCADLVERRTARQMTTDEAVPRCLIPSHRRLHLVRDLVALLLEQHLASADMLRRCVLPTRLDVLLAKAKSLTSRTGASRRTRERSGCRQRWWSDATARRGKREPLDRERARLAPSRRRPGAVFVRFHVTMTLRGRHHLRSVSQHPRIADNHRARRVRSRPGRITRVASDACSTRHR